MSDWDAGVYHRLSQPQLAWARAVLDRLQPAAGERILDLGCGTGRPTAAIAEAVGASGFVVAFDRSAAMLAKAARAPGGRVGLVRGDGAALPFAGTLDAVFSGATFHWIKDHEALFHGIHVALRPGGRLAAQCGGGRNLRRLLERARDLMQSAQYARFFGGWSDPWEFADVPTTVSRLRRAGFEAIRVTLEPAPTTLENARLFAEFLSTVCVRHHVERLPEGRRPEFLAALTAAAAGDDPPFTLDYWRLNIDARRGESG